MPDAFSLFRQSFRHVGRTCRCRSYYVVTRRRCQLMLFRHAALFRAPAIRYADCDAAMLVTAIFRHYSVMMLRLPAMPLSPFR